MDEDEKKDEKTSADVFYDGDCPMCRAFTAHVEPQGKGDSTRFEDLRKGKLPEDIDPLAAEKHIHLKDSNGEILKGAPAVLRILERKSKYLPLVYLGRLPIFSSIAALLYAFIAANRFFLFGPFAKLYWTKNTIAIGFLIPLVITRKLWFGASSRFYALTPVHEALPRIDYPLDHFLVILMAVLLSLIVLLPNPRSAIWLFIGICVPYSFLDQSRWMPYNYQFVAMFLPFAFFNWKPESDKAVAEAKWQRICAMLSIVVLGIWFWSGIHKINMRYFAVGYPWLLSPFTKLLPEHFLSWIYATAFVSTLVESGGALLLLFKKTRRLGVLVITAMHIVILLAFGPLGHSFNHSVWSWNVAMLVFLWLFFWNNSYLSARDILLGTGKLGNGILHKILLFLFVIMPVLSHFDKLDDFFAHKLYSWSTKEAEIELLSERVINELPEEMRPWIHQLEERKFVHVLEWSYSLFESPPYHADRVFKSIFHATCLQVRHPEEVRLLIFEAPNWRTGRSKQVRYRCGPDAPVLIE